jgi:hypothetical protein
MKITKGSWHQRVYSTWHGIDYSELVWRASVGRDLSFCKYSRSIIAALLCFSFVGFMALVFGGSMIDFIVYCIIHGFSWMKGGAHGGFFEGFAFIGFFITTAFLIASLTAGAAYDYKLLLEYKAEQRYLVRRSGQPKPEPGFFETWYKSVKGKFCPTLEFAVEAADSLD